MDDAFVRGEMQVKLKNQCTIYTASHSFGIERINLQYVEFPPTCSRTLSYLLFLLPSLEDLVSDLDFSLDLALRFWRAEIIKPIIKLPKPT